jgi:hypothetical protein
MTSHSEEFISAMEAEIINSDVNDALALYGQTRDGRYFWRAFIILHESGRPIPQNFLDKFAQIGQRLLEAENTANIATALEFSGNKGKCVGSPRSMAYERRWRIASEVHQVKELYSLSLNKSFSVVADRLQLTVSKVKTDYHKVIKASARKNAGPRVLAQQMQGWLK